jgi:exo-1,4-beta-D-glucosaminidase
MCSRGPQLTDFDKEAGMRRWRFCLCVLAILLGDSGMTRAADKVSPDGKMLLQSRWALQSSAKVLEKGDVLSTGEYQPVGWYPLRIPSTVVAALVQNKILPDPYFGMNLKAFPGVSYPIGVNFSRLEMPDDSPYRVPWWYRTEFVLPKTDVGKQFWLHCDGINMRANIWLNGQQIAGSDKVAGAWRLYEFNITNAVKLGETNVLAIEVSAQRKNDLGITFVDWNPSPPDKNMGLWRAVYITASGPVTVRYPLVITRLEMPSLKKAHLTVVAELRNATTDAVKGTLKGQMESIAFSQAVDLAAEETKVVRFTPEAFQQLNLANPRLWWPAQVGNPDLYPLSLEFVSGGKVSDRQSIRFGIREITSETNASGYRYLKVNGKNILVRGAGYTSEMLLRSSPERQEAEIRYVKDMNLNTIRLEGKLEDEHFLDVCDREGVLLMAGWCCCDHWERWQDWSEEDYVIAGESLKSQIRRLRSHPSLLVWLNGSDNPPPSRAEQMYLQILKELEWPNPVISSATEKPAEVSGPSGVKMTGPYEYVPPVYWYIDKTHGGAYGFNTETSPGPAVPPIESLRRFLPKDKWWPINEYWNYHAGGGVFKTIGVFTDAMNARYGTATSAEDYAKRAQVLAYEAHRAMFEAYGRNKYQSTGVIQWMLNNAWPSMIWHLYDFYLRPGGTYFATKIACEPLHIQYSYDDRSVVVVNSFYRTFRDLKAKATVYNLDMAEKFSKTQALQVDPDSSTRVFTIPELQALTTTYFVNLTLTDKLGKALSSNFYWLSTKPDVLDEAKAEWYYTPIQSYADLTSLNALPAVNLKASGRTEARGNERLTYVTLENPTRHLAFSVRLMLNRNDWGEEVLPVFWQDNYFALLPGERRTVTARCASKALQGSSLTLEVSGWNVAPKTISVGASDRRRVS